MGGKTYTSKMKRWILYVLAKLYGSRLMVCTWCLAVMVPAWAVTWEAWLGKGPRVDAHTRSLTRSLTYSLTHSLTHTCTHTHTHTHSCMLATTRPVQPTISNTASSLTSAHSFKLLLSARAEEQVGGWVN